MEVITIGRGPSNRVVINDPYVSTTHLQIIKTDDGAFRINDCGSSNGTFVNGERIYGERPLTLNDAVRIGNTVIPWHSYFGIDIHGDDFSGNGGKTPNAALLWVMAAIGLAGAIVLGGLVAPFMKRFSDFYYLIAPELMEARIAVIVSAIAALVVMAGALMLLKGKRAGFTLALVGAILGAIAATAMICLCGVSIVAVVVLLFAIGFGCVTLFVFK